LAWWEARHWNDRATLGLIFGFGALFALTMTFVYPVTAIDLFVYVANSLALVHYHANPMITAPASVANDPVIMLAGGWASYPAPYGPLGLVINALPTLLVGRNLLANLLLLKLMFSAILLAEAFLVYKILLKYAPKYALASALFLAWNPYALFEYCANGHNDLAMMLFVLLAVLALVQNRKELAFVFVVASTLVKFATLPLLPLFFLYSVVHQPTNQKRLLYVAVVTLFSLALISALYWPFWQGWKTFERLGFQNSLYMSSFSTMLTDLSSGQVARDQAKWLGQIWFGIIYAYALFLATQSKVRLLQGCFLASFSFLAFGVTNFEIWYAIWPVIFAVLLPAVTTQLSMLLFLYSTSLSVLLYGYLWVWLGVTDSALALINDVAYLMVFGPAFLLLGGFTLQRWFSGKPRHAWFTNPGSEADK
jgi:hypothetical protein